MQREREREILQHIVSGRNALQHRMPFRKGGIEVDTRAAAWIAFSFLELLSRRAAPVAQHGSVRSPGDQALRQVEL